MASHHSLNFGKKTPSQMFDWVLNTSLHVFHIYIFVFTTILSLYSVYKSLFLAFVPVSLISRFVSVSQITCIIKLLHTCHITQQNQSFSLIIAKSRVKLRYQICQGWNYKMLVQSQPISNFFIYFLTFTFVRPSNNAKITNHRTEQQTLYYIQPRKRSHQRC